MSDEHMAPPATLRAAQAAVDVSIQALGGYWPPLANLARLFEECGEFARAVNQAHGPKRVKAGEVRAELVEELGDVLYTLLGLANSLDVDAQDALAGALDKARRRAPSPPTPPMNTPPNDIERRRDDGRAARRPPAARGGHAR